MTRTRQFGLIAAIALISVGPACAADPQKGAPSDPSPEVRLQMADVHKKMAACLESERPMADCRAEMMKSCQTLMGESGCPMMGSMGMRHGSGMMQGGPPEKKPAP